ACSWVNNWIPSIRVTRLSAHRDRSGDFARAFRIYARLVLYAHPLVRSECLDGPLSTKAPDAGVLFTAERTVGQIIDGLVVDVRHAAFHALRESRAPMQIAREDTPRQALFPCRWPCTGRPSRRAPG